MKTRKLATLSLLLAMQVALSFFFIPVGTNLRIYFTFIIMMFVASEYSLPTVIIYGIAKDLISFFIYPTGPFFIGYTLTTVLSMVIYWIFLHKEVNLLNITLGKLCTNIFANILLNSLWSYILYSKGFLYYVTKSLLKNLLMLPIEIIIFYLLYKFIKRLYDHHDKRA